MLKRAYFRRDSEPATDRIDKERGTVLLLFPTAIFVVVVMGAIAVDVSLSRVRANELGSVAASAANDALASIDVPALRNGEGFTFDYAKAVDIVKSSVRAGPLPKANVTAVTIDRDPQGRSRISVTLTLVVDFVIAQALPGGLNSTTITRTRSVTILG